MEERPNFNIKFDNSDAAALANSGFAIRCLYRDWNLDILYSRFFIFSLASLDRLSGKKRRYLQYSVGGEAD